MRPFYIVIIVTIIIEDILMFHYCEDSFTGGFFANAFLFVFMQLLFFLPAAFVGIISMPLIAAFGGLNEKCPECGRRTLETVRTRSMISGTECSGLEVRKRKTYSKDGEHSGYVDVSEPSSYAKFWITEKTSCSNCNYKNKSRYKETEKC